MFTEGFTDLDQRKDLAEDDATSHRRSSSFLSHGYYRNRKQRKRKYVTMPARRGLLAPQNTFLDTIATRFDGTREYDEQQSRHHHLSSRIYHLHICLSFLRINHKCIRVVVCCASQHHVNNTYNRGCGNYRLINRLIVNLFYRYKIFLTIDRFPNVHPSLTKCT